MAEIDRFLVHTVVECAFVNENIALLSEWNDVRGIGTIAENDQTTAGARRPDVVRRRKNSSVVERDIFSGFQPRTERAGFDSRLLKFLNIEFARKIVFHDDESKRRSSNIADNSFDLTRRPEPDA